MAAASIAELNIVLFNVNSSDSRMSERLTASNA